MPDRMYVVPSGSPRRRDRLYAHPFSTAISTEWILIGIISAAEGIAGSRLASSVVSLFEELSALTIGALFLSAGIMSIWSIFTSSDRLDSVYQVRRWSSVLVMLGGGMYAFMVTMCAPLDAMALVLGVGNGFIGLLALLSTIETEKMVRRSMRTGGYEA